MFLLLGIWRGVVPRRASRKRVALAALAGVLCYGVRRAARFSGTGADRREPRAGAAVQLSGADRRVAGHRAAARCRAARPLPRLCLTWLGIVLVVGAFDPRLWRQNLAGSLLVLCCAMTTACYFLLGERCIPELGSGGFTIVAMTAAAVVVCLVVPLHPSAESCSRT